jgi:pantoate--beta-alanine ligase
MKIVSDLKEWQTLRAAMQGRIGLVPTMGHLHEGHIALVERARAENGLVVASIFVNPTQFNQNSDFEKYKRTLQEDCALLEKAGADYVLAPDAKDMYPDDYTVRVTETLEAEALEGKFRPGHFTGMLTVVLKLLNLVRPARAYFGEKDYQQLLLVKKMARALFLPVDIVSCETVRAEDGLALSSRNARLTPAQKKQAALLPRLLMSALPDAEVMKRLEQEGFRPEYVETKWDRRLAAAWLGDVRLIDNVPLKSPLPLAGEG